MCKEIHHRHHHHPTSGKAIWFCISSSICQERLHAALLLKYTEGRANTVFSKAFNEVICTHESNIMVFCHSDAFLHAWPVERSNKFRENHLEAHRPANVMSKRSILFNGNPWSGLALSANGIPIFIMVFLLLRDMRTSATWLEISAAKRSCYCIPWKSGRQHSWKPPNPPQNEIPGVRFVKHGQSNASVSNQSSGC